MTETQFLTSTNPSELVAFLGERITDEHRLYFVEACRSMCRYEYGDYSHPKSIFNSWCTAMLHRDPPMEVRVEILRDIVPSPFRQYSVIRGVVWAANRPDGKPEEIVDLSWNGRTIPLMVDAMMNYDCLLCGCKCGRCKSKWRECTCKKLRGYMPCEACNDTYRIPRTEPRWEMMPIIADALEESGCTDQHILEHLRSERDGEACPWCDGDGWTMELGYIKFREEKCSHCKGAGRIKRRHWQGCHIIELLKGT